ncbi:DEAD/DEAH box helicase [Actinomyces vulturis]|uniref:DEAD/DEAH box helicase n=1 Tax=Actinomyces vulturis TaxID=1857645 RepID=UPI0009F5BFDD
MADEYAHSTSNASTPDDFIDDPEDPENIDHDDEPDDEDHNPPEVDPDIDDDEDLDDGIELDENSDPLNVGFIDSASSATSASSADEAPAAEKNPEDVTFADLGLPADLLKAITDMGFKTPTPIQREAIPMLLSGRDVVGVAQTGTGKTAAFGLPLLDAVDQNLGTVQALVLAPTRELALQSADAITDMAARSRGLDVVAVYGGSSYGPQIHALEDGAQVVVGTPGRVIDLIEKGALVLDDVRYFVLDEADEMLRMGFAEDVDTIASSLPEDRRTALFSATMPPAIKRVAAHHLNNPVRVEVSRQSSTVSTVHQTYAVVPFKHKVGAVSRVLAVTSADAAIVFVRTKSTAEDVAIELAGRGIQAAAISGDVPQRERERLVERLRNGTLDVLVATDVAARGLDVDRIGLVVNFDVPREAEAYVHRIGRTGRAGRSGEAVTFLTPKEKGKLRQIEKLTGTKLEEITLPTPADVSQHRAGKLLTKVQARFERGRLDMYRELVEAHSSELNVDVEDLAATLLALAVGDDGPRPRNTEGKPRTRREETVDAEGTFMHATFEGGRDREDRPSRQRDEKRGAQRGGRRQPEGSGTTYRVEVGHRDRVLPGAIVGALANEGGISGSDIGKIDILQSFSLVEIHTPLDAETLERMGRATFAGRELRIRKDEGPGNGWSGPNDRSDRPRRSFDGDRGGRKFDRDGDRGGYRGDRDNDRGGFRGKRDFADRGDRKFDRDDNRGGYRGNRDNDRGGFRGKRDFADRGDRKFDRDDNRGGYRGNRDNDRGGFRGKRDFADRGDRKFDRDNNRGGYRGNRDNDRGGFRGKRDFADRGDRKFDRDDNRGGFRGKRDGFGGRGGRGSRGY